MPSPVEKIIKFFRLEIDRGFDNRAVVGGLDKILPSWQLEASNSGINTEVIDEVSGQLSQYQMLSVADRATTIQRLLGILQSLPKPETPAADSSKPSFDPRNTDRNVPQRASQHQKEAPSQGFRQPRPRSHEQESRLGLNAPVTVLPGIGQQNAKALSSLGIKTLRDMLYYFPRRYDDYSTFRPISRLNYGETVTIIANIQSIENRQVHGGKLQLTEAIVSDGTGFLRITWFNKPWLTKQIHPGNNIVLSGKVDIYLGRLMMNSPEWETVDQEHINTNRIVPVYSTNAHLRQNYLRRTLHQMVRYWSPRVSDPIPHHIIEETGFMDLSVALQNIHFPDSQALLKSARDRLAFDEIFFLQLGVLRQKQNWVSAEASPFEVSEEWLDHITGRLPYTLTNAQRRAIEEIRVDLKSRKPLNRLVQGDVGSGKTIVAAIAMAVVIHGGGQAAIMAPTSILAEQHYNNLTGLLADPNDPVLSNNEIRLLVGSTSASEKEEIYAQLKSGEIKLIIGTHALIEDPVEFNNLQIVVIDEQHRFGVEQRSALRSKGQSPHLLVMTATPIPRSLALTLYGDLDLTVIDELPAGRQTIDTHVIHPLERERCYQMIHDQVVKGRQAFIIYPLVEQGDNDEGTAAVEEYERLQKDVFPDLRLGLLHGRMKPDDKDTIMTQFRHRDFDVLISTSVIEVGVDIPNATVMLIEGANRFGLAQLHQFRGRVGRGQEKSYCLLIPEAENAIENERLAAMEATNDGFVLAEKDLDQRGPGDFLGTRQAGFLDLRLASLTDIHLIEKARKFALELFEVDPNLTSKEHAELDRAVTRFWNPGKGDIS